MPVLDNPKHEIFAQKVARGETQTKAYILAGYANSDANASQLAHFPHVVARIREIQGIAAARAQVTADRVIAELARVGFADVTEAVKIERGKVLVSDTNDMPADLRAAISEISETRDGIKIKMHDKRAALESLGKHLGLFRENIDLNVNVSLADLVNGSFQLEHGQVKALDTPVIEHDAGDKPPE